MTEPPRPPGDGSPGSPDPTAPQAPQAPSFSVPGEAPAPAYGPTPSDEQYAPPPPSGGQQAAPPTSNGGYAPPPPTSGAGYTPTSGAGYTPPTSGAGYAPQGADPYSAPPAGAYGPPPGGYPPAGAYPGAGAPGVGGYGSPDDKTWSLVAHFGGALGALVSLGPLGFVAPLIAYLAKGQQSPMVRAQSLAALNFQLLWSIIAVVVWMFGWCLLFLPNIAVMAIQVIFGIIGGMRANDGQLYKYPMSATFIK